MNRKALVFAGIFLALALVSPVFVLILETNADDKDFDSIGPNLADETRAIEYFQAISTRHRTFLIILAIVEAVFVVLFAISLWCALTT